MQCVNAVKIRLIKLQIVQKFLRQRGSVELHFYPFAQRGNFFFAVAEIEAYGAYAELL